MVNSKYRRLCPSETARSPKWQSSPPSQSADQSSTCQKDTELRSIYLVRSPLREEWEHSIPAVEELRYSATFRALRNINP
jgi:hypothetical protein